MPGPWEKYQTAQAVPQDPAAGPWEKYKNAPLADTSSWDAVAGRTAEGLKAFGRDTLLPAFDTVSETADNFIGRPVRAAASTLQHHYMDDVDASHPPTNVVEEYKKNPQWRDMAAKAGVSAEKNITAPIVTNPFSSGDRFLKFSAADAVGAGLDTATDPTNIILPLAAEKFAAKTIPYAMRAAGRTGEVATDAGAAAVRGTGRKAARVLANVEEENFNKYLANSEQIKAGAATRNVEDIKDAVDADVATVRGDRDLTAQRVKDAQIQMDSAYQEKQRELAGKTTSLDQARTMMGHLENEKAVLGSLSDQADDALARSGKTFRRDDLIALVNETGKALGEDIIGEQAKKAVAALSDTKARLVGLPDEISGERLRNILRQLRSDIDFDLKAGEFNSELNGSRKALTKGISRTLKDAVPEYEAYMNRMSDLAQSLGDMSRHFGSEGKAIGSMEALRKGKAAGSQVTEDVLRQYAERTGRSDIIKQLDEFRANNETLGRIKGGEDLRGQFFPKEAKDLAERQAEAQMAAEVAQGVDRLNPATTQAKLRGMGRKEASIEDRRAFEALQNASGNNHLQNMEDRNVYDSFGKDATRGSRMAVVGGTAGGFIGGKIAGPSGAAAGAALGAGAGAILDKYGGVITRNLIDRGVSMRRSLDAMTSALRTNPEALGKFRGVLEGAAREGTRSLVVTHHLLMNKDPEYRAIFEQNAGDSQP